ncbi:Cyclin-Dependent Kinase (Partial), partial [Seminavis robusta]
TLQDDLEGTSLRALIVADDKDETKQWTFPPLSTQLLQSAFGGRSIALVGDSTLFYTAQWMHRLMDSSSNNNAIPNHLLESLPHRNLSNAFDAITDYFTHSNHTRYDTTSFSTQLPTATNTTGHILWKGFRGTNQRKNCLFDQYVWPSILNPQLSPGNTNNTIRTPDILIANWGLHMFYRAILKPCNVDMWFHYEDWLHKVVQVAQQTGTVQLLLFKTTNLICHNLTQQQQSTKQAKCREKLQHFQNEMTTLTESDIQRYCENGLMLDRSARALNSRLERFVRALQPPPGLTVAIYNDYDLEDCRYTADNDGIHFHPLQLPRIRYMAHLIQCLYDPNNNNNNTSSTAAMTRT